MNKKYTSIEDKMQDDYDAIAPAFDESRYRMKWPELEEMVQNVKEGSEVLDVGCGSGRLCRLLKDPQVKYTGIDISGEELKLARKNCSSGKFLRGSMVSLPFGDESFDEVFMIASLQHLSNNKQRRQSLKEAKRVLRTGGRLNLTVKAFWQPRYFSLFLKKAEGKKELSGDLIKELKWNDLFWPWSWKTKNTIYRYYHAFSRRELRKLLKQSGFKVEKLAYFRNRRKVRWYQGKNLVAVVRKVV